MGVTYLRGETLEQITTLRQDERVLLDHTRLGELYDRLGPHGAEDVVCRAMEELALRLAQVEQSHRNHDWGETRKGARVLAAIADQIGMHTLARVGRDLANCVDAGDSIALAAVLARLVRTGERSLTAVWDLQDITL